MALNIPNLPAITKENPRLGEALKKVQTYDTQNTVQVPGNAVPVPGFVNPGKL